MAGRKELLRDEAARSVGKTLGFAPLIGLAGLLFGLSLTTHRVPVIVGSALVIVVPLIVALVAGRDSSPAKPQVQPTPATKDPSTIPAVASVSPVKSEPVKTGATGAKVVETAVAPSGNGAKSEAVAKPDSGKAGVSTPKPELDKSKKSKKAKKAKKSKKKK